MDITLNQLIAQCTADSQRWFPGKAQLIENQVLCMAGEVGEVANHVKKVVRGSCSIEKALEQGLADEVVDVAIYLFNLMGNPAFKNVDWAIKLALKQAFNEERFNHHTQAKEMLSQNLYTGDLSE